MRVTAAGQKKTARPLEPACGNRRENGVLLNSCAGNIAIHIETKVQKNNNMTRGISTIPFHFIGRNDNASANRNMRTPQRLLGPGVIIAITSPSFISTPSAQ